MKEITYRHVAKRLDQVSGARKAVRLATYDSLNPVVDSAPRKLRTDIADEYVAVLEVVTASIETLQVEIQVFPL